MCALLFTACWLSTELKHKQLGDCTRPTFEKEMMPQSLPPVSNMCTPGTWASRERARSARCWMRCHVVSMPRSSAYWTATPKPAWRRAARHGVADVSAPVLVPGSDKLHYPVKTSDLVWQTTQTQDPAQMVCPCPACICCTARHRSKPAGKLSAARSRWQTESSR